MSDAASHDSSKNQADQKPKSIKVNLPADIERGVYANMLMTSSTKDEFFLDFGLLHGQARASISSRVIARPQQIKKWAQALTNQLQAYEKKFGPISDDPNPGPISFSVN